jgi:aspartate/methionine/tyrosine aminotransferase
MFARTAYLEWAYKYYGRVKFDLASSGMTTVSLGELGVPELLDDVGAYSELRRRVAAFHGVPLDEVAIALGTTQALFLAYAAVLSPGDDVLVEAPTYEPLVRIAEGLGARVSFFDRTPAARWAIDPARVSAAITNKTKLVVVTNLHNPTGVRTSDEVLTEIAKLAAARGAFLLVDEVYAGFDALTNGYGAWNATARRLGPNVIAVSSLTKAFGMGPFRVGWVLAPNEVRVGAEHALVATCGHLPVTHASVGVQAFVHVEWLAERARRLLSGKRATVEAWVQARPELGWSGPEEGLFGFVTVPGTSDLLPRIERGAASHDVVVAAGSFFGVPSGFRISWSIATEKLGEALERLERVLQTPPR